MLGKAAVPNDGPLVTGCIGLVGTKASYEMMMNCDTLLMVGSAFPYAEFLPPEGAARGVQIDVSGEMLSLRYPMEVSLVGDSAETLRALLPLLEPKSKDEWRHALDESIARDRSDFDARADTATASMPMNPQHVFRELSRLLPPNAIVTCDSGSSAVWYARDVILREGMMGSLSGGLASMGCAVPYAIAAKLAILSAR